MDKEAKENPRQAMIFQGVPKDHPVDVADVGNLRVVILYEDGHWFAQGLEIDYAEQGTSLENVKENFEGGLTKTIELNLRMKGNIDELLRIAPSEVWKDLLQGVSAERKFFSQLSPRRIDQLPFDGIEYFIAKNGLKLNVG